jgi:hypothetical protein
MSTRLHIQPQSQVQTIALGTAVLSCFAIQVVGLRFIFAPQAAAKSYGVSLNDGKAFAMIKGVRDMSSGLVAFVVWRVAGPRALGWATTAVALTPIGDALIVLATGGSTKVALGLHGVIAAVLLTAGQVLVRRSPLAG